MSEIVSLKPGPTGGLDVPAAAFTFCHALLERGLTLTPDGDRLRVSGPNGTKPDLSAEDVAQIKKWKMHLCALLAYRAQEMT